MRTVFVGDIHGCRAELEQLLKEVSFGSEDQLVSVGDLVARGPDTRGVLRLLRELGGRAVRGNHEQRLLDVHAARERQERGPRLGPSHEALLTELTPEDWQQLESLPLWLDLPEHSVRVVHAGIDPGVPMAEQDPWALMHMRTLRDGKPSDKRSGTLWAEDYVTEPHIIFGHNALDHLQLHAKATGLDTGCVYGGVLSALVLPEGANVPDIDARRACIFSVPALRSYVQV